MHSWFSQRGVCLAQCLAFGRHLINVWLEKQMAGGTVIRGTEGARKPRGVQSRPFGASVNPQEMGGAAYTGPAHAWGALAPHHEEVRAPFLSPLESFLGG